MKQQRWYTVDDDVIYVHDQPTLESSQSCSMIYNKCDLGYCCVEGYFGLPLSELSEDNLKEAEFFINKQGCANND